MPPAAVQPLRALPGMRRGFYATPHIGKHDREQEIHLCQPEQKTAHGYQRIEVGKLRRIIRIAPGHTGESEKMHGEECHIQPDQRIPEMVAAGSTLIVPLNFPMAMDVEDPNDSRFVSITDMKHWELAPTNPAALEKAGILFCLTTADLKNSSNFMTNLRKAIEHGLSETKALEALTTTPAETLGLTSMIGSLDAGKIANFIITTGNIFNEKTSIIENWIQGEKYNVKAEKWQDVIGTYALTIRSPQSENTYTLQVKSNTTANLISTDTISAKLSVD